MAIECAKAKAPPSWRWLPLRRVSEIRREANTKRKEPLLALSVERGIEERPEDGGRQLASETTESAYWIVHPNDLVFNPMWALEGSVAISALRGAVSPAYRVYKLAAQLHPPFVHHFMRSRVALEQYQALVRGVTTFDRSVTRDDLDAMPIPVPPLEHQRTIAGFLEVETTRIDALMNKKRRILDLIEERRWNEFRLATTETDAPRVPARRALLSVTDGPFGSAFTSSEYSDEGIAVIRLGNIGYAEFRDHDLVHLPLNRFAEFRHYAVRQGDVLFAGLGDERNHAGRACVAPDLGPAIVKGKCFRGRIDTTRAVPDFIALYFSSPMAATSLASDARGSTRQMINLEILKAVEVPLPLVERQMEIVKAVRRRWGMQAALHGKLNAQINLLREHRQALITAAVTGEWAVPGVAA